MKNNYETTSFDLEKVLEKMTDTHGMQLGQILSEIHNWVLVHRPGAIEEYTEGGHPEFYYGYPRNKNVLKSRFIKGPRK